ncbi:hypothetical protein CRG98_021682 [Punica granatum]|uniref:Uncharacterized protein n=1 Tax=Punica granatum TaxID=22663 RepID=A0A2I0JPV7_PUNGR|nr:hypothetical protein CRG98_021682 [Punica granatum]
MALFITGSPKRQKVSNMDYKNPSWCQNDQRHIRAHFRSILLEPRHSRTFTDAFLTRLSGHPIHERANDTRRQAYTRPKATKAMEQVSDCFSELMVSRVDPDPKKKGFPSTIPVAKGPISPGILRSKLIRGNVDVRASHHSLPTTPRTREIISPPAKQVN